MSELKIVVPVELEAKNKDSFKSEIEKLSPEVKVRLKSDGKIDGLDEAVEKRTKQKKIKTNIDESYLSRQFEVVINQAKRRMNELGKLKLNGNQNLVKSLNLDALETAIAKIKKHQTELAGGSTNLSRGWKQAIKDITTAISAADRTLKTSGQGFAVFDSHASLRSIQNFKNEIAQAKTKIAELGPASAQSVSSLNKALNAFQNSVSAYERVVNLVSDVRDSKGEVNAAAIDSVVKAREAAANAQKKFNNTLRETISLQRQTNGADGSKITKEYSKNLTIVETKLQRMQWLQENFSRAFRDPTWAASFSAIQDGFNKLKSVSNIDSSEVQRLSKSLAHLEAQARAAGTAGKTFSDRWNDAFEKFGNWMSVSTVFMEATQKLREMYDNTVAVNTAMTDLRKVTAESESSYANYLTSAARRSADMSTKITDYIGGTTEWARLGNRLGQATMLGEVSAMYYNVGDGIESVSDATLKLNSAIKAFNLDATDAMNVMDMLNHVGRFCPNAQ